MNKPYILIAVTSSLLFLSALTSPAWAEPSEDMDIKVMTDQADLIFRGSVTNIAYRDSEEGSPFTFVTYRVDDVIAGDYNSPSITLRFTGGIASNGMGALTLYSDMPAFDQGDEDILFVKDNEISGCPLVGCSDGRIRLIDGVLQDEDGYEIVDNRNPSKPHSIGRGIVLPIFQTTA